MNDELITLSDNKTWIFTSLPHGKKAIDCRWVYKIKFKYDGTIERHKTRLVAKGFTQIKGMAFFETFSHVAKLTTVKLLLALASSLHLHLHQLDVHNAFLHGDLDEDVYMFFPQGIIPTHPIKISNC